jgi:hypothetical protein
LAVVITASRKARQACDLIGDADVHCLELAAIALPNRNRSEAAVV